MVKPNKQHLLTTGGKTMEEIEKQWLPHLSSEIVADARGPELDAYVLALEGWRRGLTLKWHTKDSEDFGEMKTWFVDKPGKLFSLCSSEKTHCFFRTRGDKVTNAAVTVGSDKTMTKERFREEHIPTPEGKSFGADVANNEIIQYALQSGFPLVIKPANGSFGRGVVTNILSVEEFKDHLTYVREKLEYKDIIVEQFIPGKEYRLYVVGNEVVAAMNRVPPNVMGDGVHTIRQLIEMKNTEKKQNPRLVSCLIEINQDTLSAIHYKGYNLDSILTEQEQLFLSEISNVSIGGDPISVTNDLPESINQLAVQAMHSVPGLEHGAVDLIIDARDGSGDKAFILELNPTAQIGGLLFPEQGKANDVPAAIIDYYFPETKEQKTSNVQLYFDFTDVLQPLLTRVSNRTTVTPYPSGELFALKYTIKGDVQDIGYHRGLRKQAFERFLNGLVFNLENGDIEVAVAGTDMEMVNDFGNAIWEDPERATVQEVTVSNWNKPMKIGFEVKADLKTQTEELRRLKEELEATEASLKKAEKEYKRYNQSMSWKVTSPLRSVSQLFKKRK